MTRYQSYVICTSPRSGSTLLCKLLIATGVAGVPESYFHNPSLNEWLGYYDLDPASFDTDRNALSAIFDTARAEGTGDTGIFALRLQWHSFDFFIRQMAILHPDLDSDLARFQAAFGETLFIHLTRENKLEQAVSYVKAEQTGLWHMAPDGTELERLSEPREPHYDPDEIAKQLEELSAMDQEWDDWFTQEKIAPLRLTYADLSSRPRAVLAHVLDHLGMDPGIAKSINPGTAKLADETSKEWMERFLAERGERPGDNIKTQDC